MKQPAWILNAKLHLVASIRVLWSRAPAFSGGTTFLRRQNAQGVPNASDVGRARDLPTCAPKCEDVISNGWSFLLFALDLPLLQYRGVCRES